MAMFAQLLAGVELTPGQLAELRAITSFYYTQLETSASASSEKSSELYDVVFARVRDMLTSDQQLLFDRNREAARLDRPGHDAGTGRHR